MNLIIDCACGGTLEVSDIDDSFDQERATELLLLWSADHVDGSCRPVAEPARAPRKHPEDDDKASRRPIPFPLPIFDAEQDRGY